MHQLARTVVSRLVPLGIAPLGMVLLGGCQNVRPPDPYLGTIDGSGFDALMRGGTSGCIAPRAGYGGQSGVDPVSWFYLGPLTRTQLDISNATDLARTPPTGAYVISGCEVHDHRPFDARLDNYVRTEQYPVLSNASPEPTAVSTPTPTYKPWHVVIDTVVRQDRVGWIGCNDIKSQRSIEERAGWDRERKVFGKGDFDPTMLARHPYGYVLPEGSWSQGLDLQVYPPTIDDVRAGKVKFMDWPMVNVATPIQSTADARASCPLTTGNTARYPRFPGDPNATFQFPQQAWLRGLLSGYLDGGQVPITTDPARCPALVSTGRSCMMASDCDMAKSEVCDAMTRRCLGRVPVCPVVNDLLVPQNEVSALATGTVSLEDMNGKRTAPVLAIFAKTRGQDGFSPVCRVRPYDPAKATCGRKEAETVAPRPLCTARELIDAGAAPEPNINSATFVHCLFPSPR